MLGLIMNNFRNIAFIKRNPAWELRKRSNRDSQCDQEEVMPEKQTLERARKDKRKGKFASKQEGEFVREEMQDIREGKYGARYTKQAIAIVQSNAVLYGVSFPTTEWDTVYETYGSVD